MDNDGWASNRTFFIDSQDPDWRDGLVPAARPMTNVVK